MNCSRTGGLTVRGVLGDQWRMILTTSACLTLLLSSGPDLSPYSTDEETAAVEWLQTHNVASPSVSQIADTVDRWKGWSEVSPAARNSNLALELKNLSPSEERGVFSLDRRNELARLSGENLTRLKLQIEAKLPLPSEPSATSAKKIRTISGDLAFHYLSRRNSLGSAGVNAPLVSSRELKKMHIDSHPSYFSTLTGGSTSVGFSVVATKKHGGPVSLNAQVPYQALRLNTELAETEGYVLPDFKNPIELLSFFRNWEPETLNRFLTENLMSVPTRVNDVDKLLAYLDPVRVQQVFPDHSAFQRLATLRERLHRYVLTESDARALLLWSFERWLTSVAATDVKEFNRLTKELSLDAGTQSVFARKFLPVLNLPELSLRVPLAVGPQYYSILRVENVAYKPFSEFETERQKPWDSRRLDHQSKP